MLSQSAHPVRIRASKRAKTGTQWWKVNEGSCKLLHKSPTDIGSSQSMRAKWHNRVHLCLRGDRIIDHRLTSRPRATFRTRATKRPCNRDLRELSRVPKLLMFQPSRHNGDRRHFWSLWRPSSRHASNKLTSRMMTVRTKRFNNSILDSGRKKCKRLPLFKSRSTLTRLI